ncbi:DUF6600 domain-containing protein [Chitinophagaceae bacterium LWZ2-11]
MKKNIYLLFLIPVLFAACVATQPVVYQDNTGYRQPAPTPPPPPEASYQDFYDQLSPYGNWINYPNYGYVWSPNVGMNFQPYATNGQWVYSNYGWTWASNYNWGWAAFHYGRWFYEDGYGWLWMPGNEWAPAWVTWGQSGGYYGWAPVAPRVSINISVNTTPPARYWTFVPAEHVTRPNITNYAVNNNVTIVRNVTIINNVTNNTTVINNRNVTNNNTTVIYNRGPQVNEIERAGNVHVQQVNINESSRPGESLSNNQLSVYRPTIRSNNQQSNSTTRPAPQRVEQYTPHAVNNNNTLPNNNTNERSATRPQQPVNNIPQNNNQPQQRPVIQPNTNERPMTRPQQQQPANVPGNNIPQNNNQPQQRPVVQPNTNERPMTRPQQQQPANVPGNNTPQNNNQPQQRPVVQRNVNEQPTRSQQQPGNVPNNTQQNNQQRPTMQPARPKPEPKAVEADKSKEVVPVRKEIPQQ